MITQSDFKPKQPTMSSNVIFYADSLTYRFPQDLDRLLLLLPTALASRAKRYQMAEDAFNFVLGRLLLKEIIKEQKIACNLEDLYYNKEGKPLLNGLHFSIAHSQNLVACAWSVSGSIGLDIEMKRAINPLYFKHCFSAKEWGAIIQDKSLDIFYQYWTQKEAILKTQGVGLNRLMDIEIIDAYRALFYENQKATNMYLKPIDFGNNYIYAHLCSQQKLGTVLLKKINF